MVDVVRMSPRSRSTRALAAALALLLTALPAARAWADTPPAPPTPATPGQAHFLAGRAAYQAGSFAVAAQEFQAAYDLDKLPGLLYNVGRSYHSQYLLVNEDITLQAALVAYRRYLAEEPGGKYRKEAIQALGDLTFIASHKEPPKPSPSPDETRTSQPQIGVLTPRPLPPPVVAPLPPMATPYETPKPRKWVTPVVVVSSIVVVGLALGLGLGLGLKSNNDGGTLGKFPYP
jgi:hypothetical protein